MDKGRNGGIDEVSIFEGGSVVAELRNGTVEIYELKAEDFGLSMANYADIKPPPGRAEKAKFSKEILERKRRGAARDIVLANAAVLEYLAKGISFREGAKRAKEVLESGLAEENFIKFVEYTGEKDYKG